MSVWPWSRELQTWENTREEHDTMGTIRVPSERLWGAQTQRSFENFSIGSEVMPDEIIHAFALLKAACAASNAELQMIEADVAEEMEAVCEQIASGQMREEFPLSVWQTGSGTQSNMNMNEVIAHAVNQKKRVRSIHPNDDVNRGQSSNDTFPTAMHIASALSLTHRLFPALEKMIETMQRLEEENASVIKIGRTHLQDAVPLRLSQEISGWRSALESAQSRLYEAQKNLLPLAIGGTAVGTGLNAHPKFADKVCAHLQEKTGLKFVSAANKFEALSCKSVFVAVHGVLHALSCDLMKIANDIRWLSAGPRAGLSELYIPANEPGSSIMPGKVNPTQIEALTMVCAQVMGNHTAIGMGASQGNFELNVYMPLIAYNFLQSVRLLSDAMESFRLRCLEGLRANEKQIAHYVDRSLMLVTALTPHIGYEKAAEIAKWAHENDKTLKQAVREKTDLTEEKITEYLNPEHMV